MHGGYSTRYREDQQKLAELLLRAHELYEAVETAQPVCALWLVCKV